MSPTDKAPKDSPIELLPHQHALVSKFFDPTSKHVILLRSDVGLGKTTALVAIVRQLMEKRPKSRVLFLVPAALRSQFVERIRNVGIPGVLIDRYRFRELLDSTTGGELWPRGMVAILSPDFARQSDVRDSLVETQWDLVVADEVHTFRGARAEILRQVMASATKVVLATATPAPELAETFSAKDTALVDWQLDRLVDHDGRRLDSVPRPVLHEIPFSTTPAEASLREVVTALYQLLGGGIGHQDFTGMVVLRCFESSPSALEGALRRLAERMIVHDDLDQRLVSLEDEIADEVPDRQIDDTTAEKASALVDKALQAIEAISADSKLAAFGTLLDLLNHDEMPSRRICVLTDYLATLYYLAAEIEGRGIFYQLLQGSMPAEDRHKSLSLFSAEGEILLATRAVMTDGAYLSEVTDLVLYDIPATEVLLQQILGRFDRFGRSSQLCVHVFVPSDGSDEFVTERLSILRGLLGPSNIDLR